MEKDVMSFFFLKTTQAINVTFHQRPIISDWQFKINIERKTRHLSVLRPCINFYIIFFCIYSVSSLIQLRNLSWHLLLSRSYMFLFPGFSLSNSHRSRGNDFKAAFKNSQFSLKQKRCMNLAYYNQMLTQRTQSLLYKEQSTLCSSILVSSMTQRCKLVRRRLWDFNEQMIDKKTKKTKGTQTTQKREAESKVQAHSWESARCEY